MKIGARIAHFAIAAGMMKSTSIVTKTKPISSQTAPMLASSSQSPSLTAATCAMFEKLKYAMNCAISRNRNSRLARPAHDFVIEASTSSLVRIVPAPRP